MKEKLFHAAVSGSALSIAVLAVALASAVLAAQQDTEQIDVVIVQAEPFVVPEDLAMRARLKAIVPQQPTAIQWRYGGEGQGGEVARGMFPKPGVDPSQPVAMHALEIGQWSDPVKVGSLAKRFPEKLFLTVTAGDPGKPDRATGQRTGYSTGAVFEFEVSFQGKVVKTFSVDGPDGGTATIVIPAYRLRGGVTPASAEFLDELTGVLEYATRRAEFLESLPWADWPVPKKYAVVNNVGGYGEGSGYGIRTSDKAVTWAELRSLRQLGVNGFREGPEFLQEMLRRGEPEVQAFSRAMLTHVMGFPVPRYQGRRQDDPQAGCPFGDSVGDLAAQEVGESLRAVLDRPVDEVWGLTVDEIGTVIDQSAEKKAHLSVCPRCSGGFRRWLQEKGLKPSDFGAKDWSEVRPLDVWGEQEERPWLGDPGAALAAYYTRDFNNYVTAMLFTSLRDAFAEANRKKRQSLAGGEAGSGPARQPWIYSYALRGNTFLMKGHSLDFFDFYRLADNAVVYETSNRGPRIWGWDSYLCDVQRVLGERLGLAQGIYIKPHRGAPLQRMLSAASRGDTMIYWYTYGPDYKKGDSFSQDPEALRLTSKAAHLLGKAEDALYGSRWAMPAEVAVVKPETTQRWMNLLGNPPHLMAAWENAKWVYSALQHAHVPVDPIDEHMLAGEDLSRYKVIYASGSHVTRRAAEGLARYVAAGGTLYTSGWGLARDEANQPLTVLEPVLGLHDRREPEMWYQVTLYGASSIESYSDAENQLAPVPQGSRIVLDGPAAGSFMPVIGREVLSLKKPAAGDQSALGAQVLAAFADGSPALVRRKHGRGEVYVAAFFPGLEYSAGVRRPDYNMRRDFDPTRRDLIAAAALRRTRPVVDASEPLVEGVLLFNETNGMRAVTLANWAYGVTAMRQEPSGRQTPVIENLPVKNLRLAIRGAGQVRRVTSCMLGGPVEFTASEGEIAVLLPLLEEGDVLLIE